MPEAQERTPLYQAIYSERYSRQNLIKQIEEKTKRKLIIYFSNIFSPYGSINRNDIAPFGDLLMDIDGTMDLDLLINSGGGDIDSAEKIVFMCRNKCRGFRVIVPQYAKSAATLITLAADKIVMGYTSELGPIDPQISITLRDGKMLTRPAYSYLQGLKTIRDEIKEDPSFIQTYLPLLEQLDPALLDYCKKAIERSKRFALKWLSKCMFKDDYKRAESTAAKLTDIEKYITHGVVIGAKEAKDELGLEVDYLEPDNDLWQRFWGLYCRYEVDIRKLKVNKIFESNRVSLTLT